MPPIKGKMMGRMGRSMQPSVSEFERVKNLGGLTKKKASMHISSGNKLSDLKDDNLLKLRYPTSIRQILPSVKKFKGARSCPNVDDDISSVSDEASEAGWDDRTSSSAILGTKKSFRGSGKPKYFLRAKHEERFRNMIWDLAFAPNGDIVVSSADGIFICGENLRMKQKLDKVILAGGVSFMSDGRIVAVCRNRDTVNLFSCDGEFLSSFPAGMSPMSVTVDERDRLLVCDPGTKCVYIYNETGALEATIGPSGSGFSLRWPLYASCHSDSTFLISDCHSQTVLVFKPDGELSRDMKLVTYGSNQVLRPHGLCIYNSDVFVIDNATDSVEVFDKQDSFIQTLIPQEEGHTFRPKVLSVNDKFLVIGGLSGIVRLYEFVAEKELDIKPHLKTPVKRKSTGRPKTVPKLKIEIKHEPVVHTVNGDSEDLNFTIDETKDEMDGNSEIIAHEVTPKLLNTPDDPVVLDSDSDSEFNSESENEEEAEVMSEASKQASENEEEAEVMSEASKQASENEEEAEVMSEASKQASESIMETSDAEENNCEGGSEVSFGEKIQIDEVIILDD